MTAPGTDLTFARSSLTERMEWSRAIAQAGDLVPSGFRNRDGSANPAKVLLAVETGNQLGLHPMTALTGIHVIEGKPTPSAALMTALVRRAGHRLHITGTGRISDNTYVATATLTRADDPQHPFTATWDMDRAKRADLLGKGNWKKYPENMLKARALAEVARDGASDALLGMNYLADELGAETDEDGNVIDVTDTAIDVTPARDQSADGASAALERRSRPAYDQDAADTWATSVDEQGDVTALRRLRRDATDRGALWQTSDGGWDGIWVDDPDRVADPQTLADLFRARAQHLTDPEPPMVLDGDRTDTEETA